MNKINLFLFILGIASNIVFCDFNYNEYCYNPNGWKLPDINKFEKVREEKLDLKVNKGSIFIEHFSKKSKKKYFIFENICGKGYSVFLNRKTRYEISNFSIVKFKDRKFEKILLYVIEYFDQEEIVENHNGKILTVFSGGGLSFGVLMDLDGDGIFKLFYDGIENGDLDPSNRIKTLANYSYKKYLEHEKR
jgi:hypothetical protein